MLSTGLFTFLLPCMVAFPQKNRFQLLKGKIDIGLIAQSRSPCGPTPVDFDLTPEQLRALAESSRHVSYGTREQGHQLQS